MKQHVLIVDDDEMIQETVAFLAEEGLQLRTSRVSTGAEMHAVLKEDSVSLLVLDLSIPDEDGLVLARQVRMRSELPILILTADQKRQTLLSALEIGVDDFVKKPFDPHELQLRIRNLLRRNLRSGVMRPAQPETASFAGFRLIPEERILVRENGDKVQLTHNEFNLLAALSARPNRAFSRAMLLDAVSRGPDAPTERAIDVYISQLRAKVEDDPRSPKLIRSVRGYGYKLSAGNS